MLPSNVTNLTWANATLANVTQVSRDLALHPIFITIATIICISNCLVLVLFSTQPTLRSPGNYFLCSLAVSDLAVGLFGIPVNITCEVVRSWGYCVTSYSMNRFIAISTVYHILWITLEKYAAILYPLQHRSRFDRDRVLLIILVTWCGALLVTFVELAWLAEHQDPNQSPSADVKRKEFIYNIFTFTACFALPIMLMVYAYASIFLRIVGQHSSILRRHTVDRTARQMPQKIKTALLFFTLLVIFVVCWFWWFFATIYNFFDADDELPQPPDLVYDIVTVARYSTSIINPLLYTFFKRDFRKGLKKLINGARLTPVARRQRNMEGGSAGSLDSDTRTASSRVSRGNSERAQALPPYLGFPQALRRV